MNYKKKIIFLIVATLLVIGIGYSLNNLVVFEFDTCGYGYSQQKNIIENTTNKIELTPSCTGYRGFLESLDEEFGVLLMLFAGISLLFLIILFFMREEVFRVWYKFSIVFLPIAPVLIMLSSPHSGGFIFPSDREITTAFLPVFFIVASIVIILTKSFRPTWRLWLILPFAFILSVLVLIIIASIL